MPLVRPLREGDLEYLAGNLRQADIDEMLALDGSSPMEGLTESVNRSVYVRVMEHKGVPFGIFGVARYPYLASGVSWMLGTEDLKKHSLWFCREHEKYLDEMHQHAETFGNLVDVRNTVHIRWLRWAGFTFGGKFPHGGTLFWQHWRTKKCA